MFRQQRRSHLLNNFKIHRVLGSGAFGVVLKCIKHSDNQLYALKVAKSGMYNDQAQREIENICKVSPHKNLVRYFAYWQDEFSAFELQAIQQQLPISDKRKLQIPMGHSICIQMELCGHDLRYWIGQQQIPVEIKCKAIFNQIAEGLQHIHKHGIIHRDLKPENIFLGQNDRTDDVKIGDLGIAKQHLTEHFVMQHTAGFGTPLYLAPEQMGNLYGKSVDLYALGIILYEMLCPHLQPIKNNGSWNVLMQKLSDLKQHRKVSSALENFPKLKKLVLELTSHNPAQRPKFAAIFAITANYSHRPSRPVHFGYNCDGCHKCNIEGARYHCTICPNYDLCETCVQRQIHPSTHKLLKFLLPQEPIRQKPILQKHRSEEPGILEPGSFAQALAKKFAIKPQDRGSPTKEINKHLRFLEAESSSDEENNYYKSESMCSEDEEPFYNHSRKYSRRARCNRCRTIVDTWYHCCECEDFDYCIDCFNTSSSAKKHSREHEFTKFSAN